jgi:hypothetical protein
VGDLDQYGLSSLLELIGVCHPSRLTLFYGKECVLIVRDERFCKTLSYPLKQSFGASPFCKL